MLDVALKILQAAGPYSTPAAGLMALAIWYLVKQLERMEVRATTAEKDATMLRDRRAEDLAKAATAMGEFGNKMQDRLREMETRIDAVLEQVQIRRPR